MITVGMLPRCPARSISLSPGGGLILLSVYFWKRRILHGAKVEKNQSGAREKLRAHTEADASAYGR